MAPPGTGRRGRYTLTPLVGRDAELADLTALALAPGGQRVLTLTGPVGAGKSRLATALFDGVAREFTDGGQYLELDALDAAGPGADLPAAIVAGLGLDTPPRSRNLTPTALLASHLSDRDFLLVLDCGSRPPDGVAALVDALAAAATGRLCVLTVGTEVLGVYGERRLQLAPLPVPGPGDAADLARLEQVPSVRLLVQRTRAVRPGFRLTEENREAVAELCVRLDGLPLAIELAASRLKVSSPRALLDELNRYSGVLRGTAADTMSPHLSMRDAVAHGWARLAPPTRTLLTHLAVFASTFDGSEVSGVFRLPADDAQDALEQLVDSSLLLSQEQADGSIRFRMLRTSRAHALEELERGDALRAVRADHAAYFLRQAHEAVPRLNGPEQAETLRRFGHWHEDLLVALEFLANVGDADAAASLAVACAPYWLMRGQVRAAVQRLTAVAPVVGSCRPQVTAAALSALGEAELLAGNPDGAARRLEAAQAQFDALGDLAGAALVAELRARTAQARRDLPAAVRLLHQAQQAREALGDQRGRAVVLRHLAEVCRDQGDTARAARHAGEAVRVLEEVGDARAAAQATLVLAGSLTAPDDRDQVERMARRSLLLLLELGDLPALPPGLVVLTETLTAKHGRTGDVWERAARVLAAASELEERVGGGTAGWPEAVRETLAEQARERLGDEAFESAWRAGRALTAAQAVREAVAPVARSLVHPLFADDSTNALTRREQEVAALVAEGLTNREVARRLGISEWTAVNHLRKVMRKLDCASRVQVANRVLRTREAGETEGDAGAAGNRTARSASR
ncbi:ATP-binding protein [Wenjunlia vitaminophila]|uniref:ATP-binding protein n=1 Tax=Wenjunlia vitaminophila TaxID=76728 RepID=UPI0003A4AD79|nr:LuxR C-terminal-related transcriptional regulator [Wenjunlia vitaminophila]